MIAGGANPAIYLCGSYKQVAESSSYNLKED
jgi:hypothetical protein